MSLEGSSDEESEASVDVVEGHEVVLKTSSEKTTSDDPDYLQLLEAHQQRLEDAASGMFMCCRIINFSFLVHFISKLTTFVVHAFAFFTRHLGIFYAYKVRKYIVTIFQHISMP